MLFFFFPCFSQTKEIFRDDFKDNARFWPVVDVEIASASVINGHYFISCKQEKEKYLYLRPVYFDPYEDFSIETRLKLLHGQEDDAFGMVFGASDEHNFYSFEITLAGEAYVVESNKQLYRELKKVNAVKVNPIDEYNVLKISRMGKTMVFFLNEVKLFALKIKDFYGLYVGFVLNRKIQVAVDYIVVKQDRMNIDVVDNIYTGIRKVNLGPQVNTPYEELMPVISPDGKTLYVTIRGHPSNIGGVRDDDIWYAEAANDTLWKPIVHMGPPLNNEDNNSVLAVSSDGNRLYLNGTYGQGEAEEGAGISVAFRTAAGWSKPQKIPIDNFYNYSDYSSFAFSADENYLIVSLQREDSYGDLDLYVCFRKEDGSYTAPKNLGPQVNTVNDDVAPFLAADNVTLFYATRGRPGFGSMDIFTTRRLDESWTKWSPVKNMGPEVNSTGWDAYFSVPASGQYAYLVSYRNTYGKSDVFRIPVPPQAQPNPVVLVMGKVINPETRQPIRDAEVEYYDLTRNKMVGKTRSSPVDGSYKIILPYGKIYTFIAKKDSFYSESNYMDLSDLKNYQEVVKDIVLAPLKTGQVIRMNNLFFDTGKADLDPDSRPEMDRLVVLLKQYPLMKIEIAGHTDNVGDDEYNMKLSRQRAEAVRNYLLDKKIDPARLIAKGYGESHPCADNNTEFGRSLNRRVEFVILSIQ